MSEQTSLPIICSVQKAMVASNRLIFLRVTMADIPAVCALRKVLAIRMCAGAGLAALTHVPAAPQNRCFARRATGYFCLQTHRILQPTTAVCAKSIYLATLMYDCAVSAVLSFAPAVHQRRLHVQKGMGVFNHQTTISLTTLPDTSAVCVNKKLMAIAACAGAQHATLTPVPTVHPALPRNRYLVPMAINIYSRLIHLGTITMVVTTAMSARTPVPAILRCALVGPANLMPAQAVLKTTSKSSVLFHF